MANGFQSREIAPQPASGLNSTGVLIPRGTIVLWGAGDTVTVAAAATAAFAGVTGEDIAPNAWGRIIQRGVARVIFAAAQVVGARVTSDAAGNAVAAAAGNAVLGIAREVGAAATLGEVDLVGPGGVEMP
jgi:hypothetical protein